MAIAFRNVRVKFDPTQGRLQTEPGSVNFNATVKQATCVLNGFNAWFVGGDHPLKNLQINIRESDMTINGNNVGFKVDYGLKDNTGNYDDTYQGWVDVTVIAETA